MALFRVPDKADRLWNEWNLRGAVLFSLFLQVLLIFCAPLRKTTKNRMITSMIWLAYLLADWVAVFAIGLISSNTGGDQGGVNCDKLKVNKDLAAFWAPFLLLHLGGPDTITAFSQEDNELWLRHLLGMVFQLAAVFYVISQSIPNEFYIPTLLLYFAGAIGYAERIRALFLACLDNQFIPAEISNFKSEEEHIRELEAVQYGKLFFNTFKGLIINRACGANDSVKSRSFLLERKRTCEEAFRIMEVELNFMYDVVYTKMGVVHSKLGYIFRLVCSVLIVVSFQQFAAASHHKVVGGIDVIHIIDIGVTYTLLIGAVGLDLVSLLMLIFSDWTLASVKNTMARSIIFTIRKRLIPPILLNHKRWSQSVSQFNLISYSLAQKGSSRLHKLIDFLGLKDLLDELRYVNTEPVKDNLKEFIFTELRKKAVVETLGLSSSKGKWTLSQYESRINGDHYDLIARAVSEEVAYEESVLMWHIATDMCYSRSVDDPDENKDYCKILSDYMLYLLVMQKPTVMLAVDNATQLRFRDLRSIMSRYRYNPIPIPQEVNNIVALDRHLPDRKSAQSIKSEALYKYTFDITRVLVNLEDKKMRWEMMSRVWVELLCFGASHCRERAHAQRLSNGGELITLVWLLMAHLGLGEYFVVQYSSTYEDEGGEHFLVDYSTDEDELGTMTTE